MRAVFLKCSHILIPTSEHFHSRSNPYYRPAVGDEYRVLRAWKNAEGAFEPRLIHQNTERKSSTPSCSKYARRIENKKM
jgi:hypothetical protein